MVTSVASATEPLTRVPIVSSTLPASASPAYARSRSSVLPPKELSSSTAKLPKAA